MGSPYVAEGGVQLPGGRPDTLESVPDGQEETVNAATEEYPGERILIGP